MRWLSHLLWLALLGLAQALSSSGNRLLVVSEQSAEKEKYSKFWGDLESMHLPKSPALYPAIDPTITR